MAWFGLQLPRGRLISAMRCSARWSAIRAGGISRSVAMARMRWQVSKIFSARARRSSKPAISEGDFAELAHPAPTRQGPWATLRPAV
ncbi:hypothetical protein BAY59_27100 [Prauserella coralliicola]|nr:hypothetical protein BAY59_27100 [Prauserella coralliicola]